LKNNLNLQFSERKKCDFFKNPTFRTFPDFTLKNSKPEKTLLPTLLLEQAVEDNQWSASLLYGNGY